MMSSMPSTHLDEKTLNGFLATALAGYNPAARVTAETTGLLQPSKSGRGEQPDIMIERYGRYSVLVENKYKGASGSAHEAQCQARLKLHWKNGQPVHSVVAMVTPDRIATSDNIAVAINSADDFGWAVWTLEGRRPATGWIIGGIADLMGFIDRIGIESAGIDSVEAVRRALDIAATQAGSVSSIAQGFGKVMLQEPGEQANRMAMAVVFNAIVFQSHIAVHHQDVKSPAQMLTATPTMTQVDVLSEWDRILKINYWPIFGISRDLIASISDQPIADSILRELFKVVTEIASTPGSQGLVGRIFGELIGDRKFLATFYTLPSSSALLAEAAVERLQVCWDDPDAVASLTVADLACGTGALLTAAYARITERHLLAGCDPEDIHQRLMEESMIGCDIMPAAVHLTAARLSGEYPGVDYTTTRTWVMPFGVEPDPGGGPDIVHLGSLDLLHDSTATALWGDGSTAVGSKGDEQPPKAQVSHRSLDLAIMNPPFTRPTNHEAGHRNIPNPAFAGMGNDEADQDAMSGALKKIAQRISKPKASSGNAGLASNFVDLANAKLKPGGVLALVLPAVAVSGSSWANARELICREFRDICVFSLSGRARRSDKTVTAAGETLTPHKTARAFSADTGMAEILLVATKRTGQDEEKPPETTVRYVMLDDRPKGVAWGVEMARSAERAGPAGPVTVGSNHVGWTLTCPFDGTGQPIGVVEADLAVAASGLTSRSLVLPRTASIPISTCALGELGDIGPVHRDINGVEGEHPRGPFDANPLADRSQWPQVSYPILWAHQAKKEKNMEVLPDSQGRIRPGMRSLALKLWKGGYSTNNGRVIAGATRLHINYGFRVTSQPLGACLTPDNTLGGQAWPSFACNAPDKQRSQWDAVVCLWLNSSLGLLARWWVSSRQQQGRANLTVTTIATIPVLDPRCLSSVQLTTAEAEFWRLAKLNLQPANRADDPARRDIDETLLCGILGLPRRLLVPLSTLRKQWCVEPSNRSAGRRFRLTTASASSSTDTSSG